VENSQTGTFSDPDGEKQDFVIYPVPADRYLNIDFSGNEFESYVISGIEGRILIRQDIPVYASNLQIPIYSLPSGIYFIRMNSGKDRIYRKFVIR
jgi:hypothetical protein